MEQASKYKIVGDVYEVQDDGTLVHMPAQKVLSRMSYKHEQYVIVDRPQKRRVTVTREAMYLVMGLGLIAVTVWAAVWAKVVGLFL